MLICVSSAGRSAIVNAHPSYSSSLDGRATAINTPSPMVIYSLTVTGHFPADLYLGGHRDGRLGIATRPTYLQPHSVSHVINAPAVVSLFSGAVTVSPRQVKASTPRARVTQSSGQPWRRCSQQALPGPARFPLPESGSPADLLSPKLCKLGTNASGNITCLGVGTRYRFVSHMAVSSFAIQARE